MKKIAFSLFALLCAGSALPAQANDILVPATMQRCATNEDCTLVTNSCQDNCAFVPVHKENLPTLQKEYQARCGKSVDQNPACNMNPPLSAACINSRCTIDYAYKNNSSAGDYQSGAYGVPPAPVPDKVNPAPYKNIDDRHGFTAYNLPQNDVKADTVGTLHTTVYVPPSAPVSGGNYVPVGQAAAVPAADPAPAIAPAPTMVPAAPVATTAVPTPPPAPVAPTYIPPVAPSNVPANVPVMTPSLPNQMPPAAADATVPAMPAVPATPAPTTYVAPDAQPTGPVIPSIGATGVPVAPPGSTPIPPSDLKPAPSYVPQPGGTSAVNPEDPGAPPPAGTKIMLKGSEMETDALKSFTAKPIGEKKAAKLGSFN
jgi:hypothetical protein